MPATTAPRKLVALACAADHYDVSTKTLRRRIAEGTLTAYRVGRLIKIDLNEADAQILRPVRSA